MGVTLTGETAQACAEHLAQVCDRLKGLVDFSTLLPLLTADEVLAAAIAGAPPSPCARRVEQMLAGGLNGLRAFLHLSTEAAALAQSGFDPGSATTPLEPTLPIVAGQSAFERMLARHRALFVFEKASGVGPTIWSKAHAQGLATELELVEQLVERSGTKADRGIVFWYDPAFSALEIDMNADIAMRLGLVVAPRSAADHEPFRATYRQLLDRADGR